MPWALWHGSPWQRRPFSLAQRTQPHFHPVTEELYYLLRGEALMRFPGEERLVGPGDAIAIPPGVPHQIKNVGADDLVFLCCCVPAYEHDDTVMVEPWSG